MIKFGYLVYDVANYKRDLISEAKKAKTDVKVALNAAATILARAIRVATPNSKTSGRSEPRRAAYNRQRWGILKNAVGKYETRGSRLKAGETAGVNVGYLSSKQKKYFVALFQEKGAYNALTRRFENYHRGYVKRVEQATESQLKQKFEEVVNVRVSDRMQKLGDKWTKF